ncbi:MAG: hypothetical protein MUQ10_05815 [Anaerolineae bacterium]|nr:hypothetical protein [Anaerolineae bacterium]
MVSEERETRLWNWLTALTLVAITLITLLVYDKCFSTLTSGFLNPVFWNPYTFVGSYLLCACLVVIVFVRGRLGLLARVWMLTGMAAMLAFPLLSPFLYDEHQLYAKPAPGYEMQWVTHPESGIGSALKTAQREHEGSWCRYTLHGWSNENVLYYGSSCRFGYWRYDPATEERRRVISIPEYVRDYPDVNEEYASVGQGMTVVHLQGFDSSAQYPVIVYYSAMSPDGQWLAVAVREYYGPHDVVILKGPG